jgi:hypothetical protein
MAKRRIRLFNQNRAERQSDVPMSDVAKDRTHLFNQLTLLLLVLTPLVLVCYLLVLLFPAIPINPLPPVAQGAVITLAPTLTPSLTATPTHTPRPTNTATAVQTATPTATPAPTDTPAPAGTRRSGTPTRTPPTGSPTPAVTQSAFNYTYDVNYQRAQLYGTNWAGIAGLVLSSDLKHQANIVVHAWGDPPLGPEGQTLPSGTAVQYGASGWEFTLSDKPAFGKWNVQLLNDDGTPLSPVVEIEMKGDPSGNLAYVIFTQNH